MSYLATATRSNCAGSNQTLISSGRFYRIASYLRLRKATINAQLLQKKMALLDNATEIALVEILRTCAD